MQILQINLKKIFYYPKIGSGGIFCHYKIFLYIIIRVSRTQSKNAIPKFNLYTYTCNTTLINFKKYNYFTATTAYQFVATLCMQTLKQHACKESTGDTDSQLNIKYVHLTNINCTIGDKRICNYHYN